MKNIKFYTLSFLALTFVSLFFVRCSNSDSSQTSAITVKLVDAPGDYAAVNIDVRDIMIKDDTNPDDQGWVSIGNTPSGGKIYNLLDYTGGVSLTLSDTLIPSAYLGQLRLILGDKNTIVLKDGTTLPLKTPSAQQSGLKLKVNQTLLGGVSYDFLMDFDADHSVVKAGNSGNYNLHPVIRVTTSATSGVIKGTVTNIVTAKQVLASVQVGTETITSYANAQGVFQLNGVAAGTYTITLTPDPTSGLAIKTISSVVVINGTVKDLGNITL
jgi:hypothetical protein